MELVLVGDLPIETLQPEKGEFLEDLVHLGLINTNHACSPQVSFFASCWQAVKRKPWNISHVMRSTNQMQTSQVSWCYCETCNLDPHLMISQPRPLYSHHLLSLTTTDLVMHTTGGFNPFCWTVIICCQKCGLKASACRIAPYTTHSPIIELDLRVLHCVHGG